MTTVGKSFTLVAAAPAVHAAEVQLAEAEYIAILYESVDIKHNQGGDGTEPTSSTSYCFQISPEGKPHLRATLSIVTSFGYPLVAPSVSLQFFHSTVLCDIGPLKQQLHEAILSCQSTGMGSIHSIVTTAENFLNNYCHDKKVEPPIARGSSLCPKDGSKAQANGDDGKTMEAGPPSPLNDVIEAKDIQLRSLTKHTRRLGALLLHVLSKLCVEHSHGLPQEAKDNFDFLRKYLSDEVQILPGEVNRAWQKDKGLLRAVFKEHMNRVDPLQSRLCLRWFWEAASEDSIPQAMARSPATLATTISSRHRFSYEFIQQMRVGAGGFAPVYICRKKVDGRLYAVKKVVIKAKDSSRALREVQTLASLEHENIVRYFDAWLEPGVAEDLKEFAEQLEDEENEEEEEVDEKVQGLLLPPATAHKTVAEQSRREKKERFAAYGKKQARGKNFFPDVDDDDDDDDESDTSTSEASTSGSEEESSETEASDSDVDFMTTPQLHGEPIPSPLLKGKTKHTKESPKGGLSAAAKDDDRYQTLYIQMELCAAKTLRHLLDSGRFSEENGEKMAASILRQLLSVVGHVHREQVVHRDLKPDNILFQQTTRDDSGDDFNFGTIKVADFGLARTMTRQSHLYRSHSAELDRYQDDEMTSSSGGGPVQFPSGSMDSPNVFVTGNCGTILYSAPEQENGSCYGVKVDEYSVGMIALEMWLSVAGKDFRERFQILSDVHKRHGQLPMWFHQWSPKMAKIIASLLQNDPRLRATCESILSLSDLPGEPPEVTTALETISSHAPRMAGRVFQRFQQYSIDHYRKQKLIPPAAMFSLTAASAELQRCLEVTAMLHNGMTLPFIDPMLPLAESLKEANLSGGAMRLMDDAGRCYVYSAYPQFSVASFLSHHRSHLTEDNFCFLHNRQHRPIFNFGSIATLTSFDHRLQPVLYLLHVLGSLELPEGARFEITFSCGNRHSAGRETSSDGGGTAGSTAMSSPQVSADLMTEPLKHSTAKGNHEGPTVAVDWSEPVAVRTLDDAEVIVDDLSALCQLPIDDEKALKETVKGTLIALPLLFRSRQTHPTVFVSSTMALHDDAPVHSETIEGGTVIEVRYRSNSTSNLTTVAAGCCLSSYISLFAPHHSVRSFMVSIDIAALGAACKKVRHGVQFASIDGVVVSKCHDGPQHSGPYDHRYGHPFSPGGGGGVTAVPGMNAAAASNTFLMESACRLWVTGIRTSLRSKVEKDLALFRRFSADRQYSWWLNDTMKLITIPSLSGKVSKEDVALETLGSDVRSCVMGRHMTSHAAGDHLHFALGAGGGGQQPQSAAAIAASAGGALGAAGSTHIKVEFAGKEDSSVVQEARDLLNQLAHPPTSVILAVNCTLSDLFLLEGCCVDDGGSLAAAADGAQGKERGASQSAHRLGREQMVEWLRRHAHSHSLLPIYSIVERRIEFLVNNGKVRKLLKTRESKKAHKERPNRDRR